MDHKKIEKILSELKGVTYPEWQKISIAVNRYFDIEISNRKEEITVADLETMIHVMKKL